MFALLCFLPNYVFLFFLILFFFVAAAKNAKENFTSSEPSVRFKNGVPHHSVDLSASCPRCLAAAAEKPNGSDGEFSPACMCERDKNNLSYNCTPELVRNHLLCCFMHMAVFDATSNHNSHIVQIVSHIGFSHYLHESRRAHARLQTINTKCTSCNVFIHR